MAIIFSIFLAFYSLLAPPAFAQDIPCNATGTICGQTAYDTCNPICNGSQAAYDCYQASNPKCRGTILCYPENSRCQTYSTPSYTYPTPSYSTPSVAPTCQTDCSKCALINSCGVLTYDTCVDDKGGSNINGNLCQNGATKFRCSASLNKKCVSDTSGGFNYSCSACGFSKTPTPTPQPTATPTPTPRFTSTPSPTVKPTPTPQPVTITGLTINGAEVTPQVGSQIKISLPLTSLPKESSTSSREASSIIPVLVRYSDGTNRNFFINFKYQPKIPEPKIIPEANNFPVDVIIHKSLTNQDEVEQWAKDTINNYTNVRFANAGIKQKVFFNKAIKNYDETAGCPDGGTTRGNTCEYADNNKVRTWLYKNGSQGDAPTTSAGPHNAQIWMTIPTYKDFPGDDPLSEIDKRALTHEMGHLFKMPDYYNEDVNPIHNKLTPNVGIAPFSKDIMWNNISYDYFSPTSKNFAERTTYLPAGFGIPNWYLQYLPKHTVIKITNDDNSPLAGVKVEVFPQSLTKTSNGTSLPYIISPDIMTINATTNNKGEVDLGDYMNILHHVIRVDNYPASTLGHAAFLRITNGDKVRYTAISRSYLNTLYFEGQTEIATITKSFSSLLAYDPNKYTILAARKTILTGDGTVSTVSEIPKEERKILDQHLLRHLKEDEVTSTNTDEPIRKITSVSTLTPTPTPTPTSFPKATPTPTSIPQIDIYDLNSDGVVNIFDTSKFIQLWKSGQCTKQIDLDGNGVCNSVDYATLKQNF